MAPKKGSPMRLIVSTMKDEGPFILEWVAYYMSIGFTNFIVNSNDCSDGTDAILERLQEMGIVRHIDNPGPWRLGPQAQAYENAMADPWFSEAEWILVCDADEFLDIRVGDGSLDTLFARCPWADAFAVLWQLFGHNGVVEYKDEPIIEQMVRASDPMQYRPQNTIAFKTLYRNNGTYTRINTHRPKGAVKSRIRKYNWADGDGALLPDGFKTRGWTFTKTGIGFGRSLVRMNHYAVRSIESYLMKRLRGDVNTTTFHPKMEATGQVYWETFCWNTVEETSILSKMPRMREFYDRLLADKELSTLHKNAVSYHKGVIDRIRPQSVFSQFVKKYENYRDASYLHFQDGVYVDECIFLSQAGLKAQSEETLAQIIRTARLFNVATRGPREEPWFSNLDALNVPLDRTVAKNQLVTPKAYWKAPDGLALPKTATEQADLTEKEPNSATKYLRSLGKKRNWTLIGAFEERFVSELLGLGYVNTVSIIAPWGLKWAEFTVQNVKKDPKRQAMDLDFLNFVSNFESDIRAGRLRVYRGLPIPTLKLFKEESVGMIAIKGQRMAVATKALLDKAHQVLEPNGFITFTGYNATVPSTKGTAAAIHEFIGKHPAQYRIAALDQPWLSIQKLAPLAAD